MDKTVYGVFGGPAALGAVGLGAVGAVGAYKGRKIKKAVPDQLKEELLHV